MSGYHSVPRRKMLWEKQPDCYNELVATSIRRTQMDSMLHCLHFRDNADMDDDSFYKVRPIFDNLNKNSRKWYSNSTMFSIDESMLPYYGRHSAKQFIRGKPVRFGYKVWTLATSEGAGVWFEPYCGRHTLIEDQGLGQGPNVVLDLVTKAHLAPGSEIFVDNLFTSFSLLDKLSEQGIGLTGTVRANRLHKVPIIQKKEMEKKTVLRGHSQTLFRADQVVCAWKDNKAVYVASNKHGPAKTNNCTRFCREKRASIQVPIPAMVQAYNGGMGGVDLLDNMTAVYRIVYRIKKWWFPIYSWSLSVSAVNAWRLRMMVTGRKEPFLDFLRELVITMLRTHGKPPLAPGPKKLPLVGDRFDGINHLPTSCTRRNCKQCHLEGKKERKTTTVCKKCDAPLHKNDCFEDGIIVLFMFKK